MPGIGSGVSANGTGSSALQKGQTGLENVADAAGTAAQTKANNEAGSLQTSSFLDAMRAQAADQNRMALTKGLLENSKEGSKAVGTFTADSAKAATAQ